jgi:hypothetical protein
MMCFVVFSCVCCVHFRSRVFAFLFVVVFSALCVVLINVRVYMCYFVRVLYVGVSTVF